MGLKAHYVMQVSVPSINRELTDNHKCSTSKRFLVNLHTEDFMYIYREKSSYIVFGLLVFYCAFTTFM